MLFLLYFLSVKIPYRRRLGWVLWAVFSRMGHASARLALRCSLLSLLSRSVSRQNSTRYMLPHPHDAACAWSHVWRVEENAFLTLKQVLKTVVFAQWDLLLLQSCGNSKTATPTQREKTICSFLWC